MFSKQRISISLDIIIRESQHFAHAYLYLCRNPVKAKIVEKVEAYRFYTLHPCHRKFKSLILGDSHGFDEHIPKIREEQLDWLNQEEDQAYSDHVRRALQKTEFSFSQNQSNERLPTYFDKMHPQKLPGT